MMLNTKRLGKGCFDTHTKKYNVVNIIFKTCLGNYQNSMVGYYWHLFSHYQNNLLPYKGSYGEQPAKIIEIFNVIQGIISEYELELEKVRKYKDSLNRKLTHGR